MVIGVGSCVVYIREEFLQHEFVLYSSLEWQIIQQARGSLNWKGL